MKTALVYYLKSSNLNPHQLSKNPKIDLFKLSCGITHGELNSRPDQSQTLTLPDVAYQEYSTGPGFKFCFKLSSQANSLAQIKETMVKKVIMIDYIVNQQLYKLL